MNGIWAGMILISLVVGAWTGTLEETVAAGLEGAKSSVETVLSFAGIMCLWTGFLHLAEKSGVAEALKKVLFPFTKHLFPRLGKDSPAQEKITENLTANFLGMGNAATPAGIAAMQELDKINPTPEQASDEMCIFAVMNTASVQLIPTTILSLRVSAGSQNPMQILVPIWISSAIALITAVFTMHIILKFRRKRILQK